MGYHWNYRILKVETFLWYRERSFYCRNFDCPYSNLKILHNWNLFRDKSKKYSHIYIWKDQIEWYADLFHQSSYTVALNNIPRHFKKVPSNEINDLFGCLLSPNEGNEKNLLKDKAISSYSWIDIRKSKCVVSFCIPSRSLGLFYFILSLRFCIYF